MSNAKSLIKQVDKLEDELQERAERTLESSMETIKREMQWQLEKNGSVATGFLLSNLQVREVDHQPGRQIAKYAIYAPDYWRFLEYGTGIYTSRGYPAPTGGAPFGPILLWVHAKGITPEPGSDHDTQEEVAAAIANSLSRGTESHPFARPAWRGPRGKKRLKHNMRSVLEKALRRAF